MLSIEEYYAIAHFNYRHASGRKQIALHINEILNSPQPMILPVKKKDRAYPQEKTQALVNEQ